MTAATVDRARFAPPLRDWRQRRRPSQLDQAVVVDRHWGMVAATRLVALMMAGVAAHLVEPPVNVLRLSLHPEGLAPRIRNLPQWRAHVLHRLGREAHLTGD